MSDMRQFPGALNALFHNPQEPISEAMWMKDRWSQISLALLGAKCLPQNMYSGQILCAPNDDCRILWLCCLAIYRAVGPIKAPFIKVNAVIVQLPETSEKKLGIKYNGPQKMFSDEDWNRIDQRHRHIFNSMQQEIMPQMSGRTTGIYGEEAMAQFFGT